jgi:predicted DCC family thiol-disulfide oxidoreductase YuxK
VANSAGCTTLSAEAVFTITLLPGRSISITGATEVCQGEQVLLTAPEGNTYQWFRSGSAIAGATSRDFSAGQSGSYRVQVTNAGICSVTSDAVEIVVNALPQVTIMLEGMEMTAPVGDYSYQWYSDGVPIAGATERTYLTFTSGTFTVRVTGNSGVGCSVMSAPFDLIVTELPQGQAVLQLDAYPNPVRNILQVTIPKMGMEKAPDIEVFSMDGRRIGVYSSSDAGRHFKAELDFSPFKQANYLIIVRSPKAILRTRIIKH